MARKARPTLRSIAAGIINKIRERLNSYEERGFDTEELRDSIGLDRLTKKKRFTKKEVEDIKRKSSSNYMRTKVEVKTDEGNWVKGLKAFKYIRARDEVKHLSTAEEIGVRLDNLEENMPVIKPSDLERKEAEPDEDTSWLTDYLQQKARKEADEAIESIAPPIKWREGDTSFTEPSIFYELFTELREEIGDEDFNDFLKQNEDTWKEITENYYALSHYKESAKEMFNGMIAKMPLEFQNKIKDYRLRTENTIEPEQGNILAPETDFAKAWRESDEFKGLGSEYLL